MQLISNISTTNSSFFKYSEKVQKKACSSYELSNHLGNVLAVITDRRIQTCGMGDVMHYEAQVVNINDYYPFGMLIKDRSYISSSYRFGFNGVEKDDEINGAGNSYVFEYRIHDPRLGRFLSVDPLSDTYPWNSPYAFAENDVIRYIDLEGLETPENASTQTTSKTTTVIVISKLEEIGTTFIEGWIEPAGETLFQIGLKFTATVGLVFLPVNAFEDAYNHPENQWIREKNRLQKEQYSKKDNITPKPTETGQKKTDPLNSPKPLTDYSPKEKPGTNDEGEQMYYLYKTTRSFKKEGGLVETSLPYYGITLDKIVGGRYSAGREEAINVEIIAVGTYYNIKGAESAIISINADGHIPTSTRIDNERLSTLDPIRVISGQMLLNVQRPGWQALDLHPPAPANNPSPNNNGATGEGECSDNCEGG